MPLARRRVLLKRTRNSYSCYGNCSSNYCASYCPKLDGCYNCSNSCASHCSGDCTHACSSDGTPCMDCGIADTCSCDKQICSEDLICRDTCTCGTFSCPAHAQPTQHIGGPV